MYLVKLRGKRCGCFGKMYFLFWRRFKMVKRVVGRLDVSFFRVRYFMFYGSFVYFFY